MGSCSPTASEREEKIAVLHGAAVPAFDSALSHHGYNGRRPAVDAARPAVFFRATGSTAGQRARLTFTDFWTQPVRFADVRHRPRTLRKPLISRA